jgi:cyclic beta-1,2-glucan synthetase
MNMRADPAVLPRSELVLSEGFEPPIRDRYLNEPELHELGASIARGEAAFGFDFAAYDLKARTEENYAYVQEAVASAEAARQRDEQITPAATWLLDNHYVVTEAVQQIKRDLPARFYRQLPVIRLPDGTEVPRVLAIAWLYVAHTDASVSAEGFGAVAEGFQSVAPLRIGELWALPSILRFVLVENLRRLARRVQRARDLRRMANEVADRALLTPSEDDDLEILAAQADLARDTAFATQLLFRLRDGSRNAGQALAWLEKELERDGTDAEEIIIAEHARQSSGNVTTGNIIRGLRRINDIAWTDWFESISKVDSLLRERTNFTELDFPSRNQYRQEIEELAKRSGKTEYDIALKAIETIEAHANDGRQVDIGSLLVGPARPAFEREVGYATPLATRFRRFHQSLGWLGLAAPVLFFTVLLMLVAGLAFDSAGMKDSVIFLMMVSFLLPASEAAIGIFNTLVTLVLKPTHLIGYEYAQGVPPEAPTLVVVPTLIGSRDDVEDAVHNLEVHYLANMGGELSFALLSDWPDSDVEESSADRALLKLARREVAALNRRYPREERPRFFVLHRRRLYNSGEGCWMGWERKRGKLQELNALLRGDRDTTFILDHGPALPKDIRYVMTVDADTRMTRDTVRRLVGKMQHPLNQPVIGKGGRIVSGHGILQPRVTASLTTSDEASLFQRIFSVNRGMDPYVFAVSDVYQDLFNSGTFTGKGLYHVDAMEAALADRIPENAVLSHDLLEGAYAAAGLASDIELVEDYPTRYAVDASRHHRWARGDWQLLPYIFGPRSGVPSVSRWKMLDNLRRSLTPLFWLIASVAGWSFLPLLQAVQWQVCLIVCLFFPATFDIIHRVLQRKTQASLRGHVNALARDFLSATAQVVMRMTLIAHSAWSMGDAIVRTLYRLFVSRKHMLEWRAASQVAKVATNTLGGYYRMMAGAVVIGVAALAIPLAAGSSGAWLGGVFGLLWVVSPAIAWFVSRPEETEEHLEIAESDLVALRQMARRTWHYFDTFVKAENHWLPPDNFQETPAPIVAERTSPTNIGVYLMSVVSARDFGWISFGDTIDRLERTIATIEGMRRHRGHLYNWYETLSLTPMMPPYVSAVDSGNLAGHLVAVAAACRQWAETPAVHLQGDFHGILDVAGILEATLVGLPDDRRSLRPLRQRLQDRIAGLRKAVETIRAEPETAAIRIINLIVMATEIRKLATSLEDEIATEDSHRLSEWGAKLEETCRAHIDDAHIEESGVANLRGRLIAIGERARKFAFEMDFSFLLREDRKLLSIGYRVEERQLDEACYDLLASEARLTSLFGIAKGDLPTEHWFKLGRPITEISLRGALVSWSGSMFEYLMPPLVMKEPPGGLLNQTNNLIIREQMNYARGNKVPWGISEAAFNARDRDMSYQYTNFGVPSLGLKRGLSDNLVIAPYASLLAAQFRPADAVTNLTELARIGALGAYGYHDSVDFTPERLRERQRYAVVRNYYAHHQGMSIVAVANAVFEGRMRDRFHSDPVIEAAELLLQEKAPRQIPATAIKPEAPAKVKSADMEESLDTRLIRDPANALPATNLLSNGHYSVMVTANGTGYSRYDGLAVTRWAPDPTEDRSGTFLFLSDVESGEWWSATAAPKPAPEEFAHAAFADDKATFFKKVGTLRSEVECIVTSEDNGEGRRITIVNTGPTERLIDVTSYAELVINADATDSAHPAFSKMFVSTAIAEDRRSITALRRPRSPGDPAAAVMHFVTLSSNLSFETEAETDRRAFIGRGRTLETAAAFDPGMKLAGLDGFTLDPCAAIRCRMRIAPGKKVSVVFWTVAAPTVEEAEAASRRLNHADSFNRQAMLAWTKSQVQTRHIGISLADASGIQRLARYLLYPDPGLRAQPSSIATGLGRQSDLWPTGISGDYPIFAIRVADAADLEIVATAMRFQEYMRARGLVADLVIVNEQAASYIQDLQQSIESICENARLRGGEHGPRQHIFAVRRDLMDEATYRTLLACARVVLHARNGTILDQIERAEAVALEARKEAGSTPPARSVAPEASADRQDDTAPGKGLAFWNGFGGFDRDGRDYVVRLSGDTVTPHPWINVVANEAFGFHASAEGACYSWSRNSRDYQLTPWSNDPVRNRPGEALYLADLDTGEAFSPVAAVVRDPAALYEARFSRGLCRFERSRGDVTASLTQMVDPADPVRISALTVTNRGAAPLRLRAYVYAEWVLGTNRQQTAPSIVPDFDSASGVMTARNPYSLEYGERVAFMAADIASVTVSSDRAEFLGGGSVESPDAVRAARVLSGRVEAGRDPCSAIARDFTVAPGETVEIVFLLGDAASAAEAAALVERHRKITTADRLAANEQAWDSFSSALTVKTPDAGFDALVNTWLPYQSLAGRIRARSGFYQASGAYGFRDQLQDTLSLLLHDPRLARQQILNAAGRQFPEGDVQHWWLPANGAGVRTTISDDVVWLAYAAHRYVEVTGDAYLLDVELPFIEGQALEPGQHDAFFTPQVGQESVPLYEHCARALDLAIARTGANGLPLILGGDWNDGMNRVGEEGRGESVWLGWFLLKALGDFSSHAEARADKDRLSRWQAHAKTLKAALEETGWDGGWYRRGFYDDGTPLGSAQSEECRIDSIAQSWAVMSGGGDRDRAGKALDAVLEQLVDGEARSLRLFVPAFEHTSKDPGYIKAYPPGVRENGGQYTHAATWAVVALAELGRFDDAWRTFSLLNPVTHSLDRAAAERYRVEPYVIAADVYDGPGRAGRGGWTWYTGSAGWMYRAAVEAILGVERRGDSLTVRPRIPGHWPGYEASLHIEGTRLDLVVRRGDRPGMAVDDKALPDGEGVPLDGKPHRIVVTIGGGSGAAV